MHLCSAHDTSERKALLSNRHLNCPNKAFSTNNLMTTRKCLHGSSVDATYNTFLLMSSSSLLVLTFYLTQKIVYFPSQSVQLLLKMMSSICRRSRRRLLR